jgi:hypothetical protein
MRGWEGCEKDSIHALEVCGSPERKLRELEWIRGLYDIFGAAILRAWGQRNSLCMCMQDQRSGLGENQEICPNSSVMKTPRDRCWMSWKGEQVPFSRHPEVMPSTRSLPPIRSRENILGSSYKAD